MGTCSDDEEREFFDAFERISNRPEYGAPNGDSETGCWVPRDDSQLDVWIHKPPESVHERRSRFFKWLGLNADKISSDGSVHSSDCDADVDRITWSSGAELGNSSFEDEFQSSRSLQSCWSIGDLKSSFKSCSTDDFVCRNGNSDDGVACVGNDSIIEGRRNDEGREADSDSSLSGEHLDSSFGSSPLSSEGRKAEASKFLGPRRSVKKWWLKKLRSFSCVMERDDESGDSDSVSVKGFQRVKVHTSKKQAKELSALYLRQDIPAHKGSILTMKFSPDGQYLASAGDDGVVRVWQVVEDERSNEHGIPGTDPSSVYFVMNNLSEFRTYCTDKEKMRRLRSMRKTSDSACVIIPSRVFRILEEPLHEFRGHKGQILEVAWSKNNYLLSSSVDETVRLWHVGCDQCIKVFLHNNYVTCVQFNPVDDNYFISGSIDGKVRIWEVSRCQVVNWTDIKDMVTAVCYRPDGQGGIVGSLTGCCSFFNISGNQLQLDAQICLPSKKKSSCKRITGFQYFPQDPSKVMVTCADSRIRILHGINIVNKYKGVRNNGNYLSASFTPDGNFIVSASEDSNVYVWNCVDNQDHVRGNKMKTSERFQTNASIAIPWNGFPSRNRGSGLKFCSRNDRMARADPFPSPACFTRSQDFFLESYPKGSATWPEEKLLSPHFIGLSSTMHKSEYRFLKTSCMSMSSSHAWGLVIVTAGRDGRIRSFLNYGLRAPP